MNLLKDNNIHKAIFLNSTKGMTFGFLSTLVVGTILGLLAINQDNDFSLFILNIKGILVYLTPFAIGISIASVSKLSTINILSIGIAVGLIGHSSFVPYLDDNKFILNNPVVGINIINFKGGVVSSTPGDVLSAWLAGIIFLYADKMLKTNLFLKVFSLPLLFILMGIILSLSLTYISTLFTIFIQWLISVSIHDNRVMGIILSPIIGISMGLALSLPTSSAAIALMLKLKGFAATAAIAGTAAQMISFGTLTFLSTKNISKTIAVGFGSSMLQMENFLKKPKLILIPTFLSGFCAMLGTIFFPLDFDPVSVTSGMGTCALYGQIFTLQENGWTNLNAWLNVILIQLVSPLLFSLILGKIALKKGFIKREELFIEVKNEK